MDSYTLVFAGLLLTMGSLGDRFGRRLALVGRNADLRRGFAALSLAGSADTLILTRGLMGVGGALIMPTTLSILTNVFPAEERAKAIGIWAAVAGLGIAIGPVAGGWLLEHFSWGSVFLVNLPVVAFAVVAAPFLVPESRDPAESRLDPLGAGLSTVGLGVLTWAIIEGQDGWTGGTVLGGLAAGAVLLAAFVAWELRAPSPMLDVRLFRVRRVQRRERVDRPGLLLSLRCDLLPHPVSPGGEGLRRVGRGRPGHADRPRADPRRPAVGGPGRAYRHPRRGGRRADRGGAAFLLSGLEPGTGYGSIAAAVVLLGLGMGTVMAPATESIMSSLPLDHAGVGSAMNDTVRLVGGTLGVAILGSLLSAGYRGDMEPALAGLPDPARGPAGESINGAAAVADRMGGHAGAALDRAADGLQHRDGRSAHGRRRGGHGRSG